MVDKIPMFEKCVRYYKLAADNFSLQCDPLCNEVIASHIELASTSLTLGQIMLKNDYDVGNGFCADVAKEHFETAISG